MGPPPAPRGQDGRRPNGSESNLSAEVQSTAQRRSPPSSRWRFHLGGGTSSCGISAGRRNTVHLGDNRITVAYMRTAGSTDGVGVGGRRSADPPRPPPLRVFAAAFAERASVRDAGLLIVNLFGRPLSPGRSSTSRSQSATTSTKTTLNGEPRPFPRDDSVWGSACPERHPFARVESAAKIR